MCGLCMYGVKKKGTEAYISLLRSLIREYLVIMIQNKGEKKGNIIC